MDAYQISNGLSSYVSKEINSLRLDDSFAYKSQEIFSKISDFSCIAEFDSDVYSKEGSWYESIPENQQEEVPLSFSDSVNEGLLSFEHEELHKEAQKEDESVHKSKTSTFGEELIHREEKIIDSSIKDETLNKLPMWRKDTMEETPKLKNKSLREVEPTNFLSLKRKDVVFKSIFRMMRRYYWKLLETTTGYNRKEKCLKSKHKELIKSLVEGMNKLNFNELGINMPFYFGAFAYPSDMRKILEESKQQFRTQNEILSQAIYIVELVDNCFNRFSKKVLNDLIAVPQFSFLIHYYLKNVDDLSEYPRPFQKWYEVLIKSKDFLQSADEESSKKLNRNNTFILREEFFLFSRSDSW